MDVAKLMFPAYVSLALDSVAYVGMMKGVKGRREGRRGR